jgi:Rrf2 family transcriptional regulator, iron-sulfur cluster assembly transcription factor
MLSLSHTTGYAIRALCCLERSGDRLVRSQQIADCTGMPKPYLSKTLHALGQSGLITTKRGYRGGFVLARPATRIRLLDIVEAVEGEAWQPRCLLGMAECSDDRGCPTHEFWKLERERIRAELARLTLAVVSGFEAAAGNVHACSTTQSTADKPGAHTGPAPSRRGLKVVRGRRAPQQQHSRDRKSKQRK